MSKWKLVPVEATDQMIDAALDAKIGGKVLSCAEIYCAMLDAAPAAPQQAEPVAWMAFGGSIVHAVTRNAMDPIEAERFDVPLYLHPPAAEVQRLREALEYLIEKCGDSDDAQYSTLGTKFVRDIARRALEGK